MKSKLLFILTLLVIAVTGAWAQTTLISYTVNEVTSATEANSGEWTKRDASGTPGGTCSFYLKWGWKNSAISDGKGWFREGSDKKVYTIGGADGSIKLSLSGSETFKSGDIVSVTYNGSTNNATGYYVRTGYKTSDNQLTSETTSTGSTWQTKTVTLDSNFELNTIYIERYSPTMNISSVTVTRPAAKTNWNEPTISYVYAPATEKYNVTITSDDSAPTLTYKIGAEGEEQTYSATFAVNPSVTVYAKASGTGYEASDWTSADIPAMPTVATPSYQVGPWNYENNGYTVTLNCPDAEASYVYMTTGSNAEGSTLDWSGATACTDGQVIYIRGTRVAIKGTRTGYTTSYDPTSNRYSLSNTTPTGVSPELVLENTSNNSGETNADHGNRAVTITSNHYAGRTDTNYLKMRVKPNNQSNRQLKIDVKDGYVVTKISFDKIQANTDYAIPVTGVTVDGEVLAGFSSFNIPASSAEAMTGKEISIAGGARSSIVFAFGDSEATQYNATITVTYEKFVPGPAEPEVLGGDAITWTFPNSGSLSTNGQEYTIKDTGSTKDLIFVGGSSAGYKNGNYLDPGGATTKNSDKWTRYFILNVTSSGKLSFTSTSGQPGTYNIYQYSSKDFAKAVGVDGNTIKGTPNAAVTTTASETTMESSTLDIANGAWIFVTFPAKVYTTKVVWTPASDDIILTTTDNMDGWRTFYDASNNYSVDGNTTVYVAASDPSEGKITLTSIDGVPAGVPVILKTTADDHKMTLAKAAADTYTYTGTNKLAVSTAAAVSDVYRLGYGDSGVGFYPYSGTPGAGIVYLNVSSASGARALVIDFDDETTGIQTVNGSGFTVNGSETYYNLSGQRVAQPTRGLYIVNGKKVVIK